MKTPQFTFATIFIALLSATLSFAEPELKIGIIGLDTSHAIEFAKLFNDPTDKNHISGAHILCAFAGGSPDVVLSASRVKGFTEQMRTKYGVKIFDTIDEVVKASDAIMILSVDGRTHLVQAKQVFGSGKPVFIDKPLGGNLAQVLEIAELAKETQTPLFSASSLRYTSGLAKLKTQKIGRMLGAISYGPAHIEPHHPDLYFYGIHSTEALFTLMGPGCISVSRTHTQDSDVVTGVWKDGRTGVVYGFREGKSVYRVTVFGTKGVYDQEDGKDYSGLITHVITFFRTRVSPVPISETIEIMAFMEAADVSKKLDGKSVSLAETLAVNTPKH
jgi:predicted dehydrogenase